LKPVTVRTGITDGAQTELIGDSLQPGTEVVTAITAQTGGGGPTIQRSPLMGNVRRF
jgi:hypothetical protein